METVAQGLKLDLIDDLTDERELEQQLGLMLVDAALLHVEHRGVVELPHRGAVGALHVVGIDLEHRLGIHACGLGHHEVLVALVRLRLLRVVAHQYATGEGADGMLVEHVFVELVRHAVAHLMVDERVVVDMLALVGDDAAVAPALGALALEREVEHVAGHAVVQRDDIVVDAAVGLLVDIDIAHARVLRRGFLKAIEVEAGILTHISLDDLRTEELAVVGRVIAEQQFGFGALVHDDEHAAVDHEVDVGAQDIDHLNGAVGADIAADVDEQAILRQHRVECGDGIVVRLRNLGVIAGDELGLLLGGVLETHHRDALGQTDLRQRLLVERIVDDEVERGAEIGHVAAEHAIGIDGDVQAIEVEAVVGREERLHVGVLIPLHLARGEAQAAEGLKSRIARCIHHRCRMVADELARLAVEVDILLFTCHSRSLYLPYFLSASSLIQS